MGHLLKMHTYPLTVYELMGVCMLTGFQLAKKPMLVSREGSHLGEDRRVGHEEEDRNQVFREKTESRYAKRLTRSF